jgi:hypothetical protein
MTDRHHLTLLVRDGFGCVSCDDFRCLWLKLVCDCDMACPVDRACPWRLSLCLSWRLLLHLSWWLLLFQSIEIEIKRMLENDSWSSLISPVNKQKQQKKCQIESWIVFDDFKRELQWLPVASIELWLIFGSWRQHHVAVVIVRRKVRYRALSVQSLLQTLRILRKTKTSLASSCQSPNNLHYHTYRKTPKLPLFFVFYISLK